MFKVMIAADYLGNYSSCLVLPKFLSERVIE